MNTIDFNSNKKKLRKVFQEILQEHPQGVWNSNIWHLVAKKLHRSPCGRDFGVSRLSDLFSDFSDLFTEETRDKKVYLIPRHKKAVGSNRDYIVVSSPSDLSDDSDATDAQTLKKAKSVKNATPLQSLTVYTTGQASKDRRSPKQLEKLKQLKENIVKLLTEQKGIINRNKLWDMYNRRFSNPRTKDYGINKMEEVYPLFSDVIKQDGNKIKLKGADSKPSAAPSWGQGAVGNVPWGQGAVTGNISMQGFASSSSTESLSSIASNDDVKISQWKNPNLDNRSSSKESMQIAHEDFPSLPFTNRGNRDASHSRESSQSRGSNVSSRDGDHGRSVGFDAQGFAKPLIDKTVAPPLGRGVIPPLMAFPAQPSPSFVVSYPTPMMMDRSRAPAVVGQRMTFLGSTGIPRPSSSNIIHPPLGMINTGNPTLVSSLLGSVPSKPPVPSSSTEVRNKVEPSSVNQPTNTPGPAVKKEVNVKPINLGRGQNLSFDQLESIANDCIDILSDAEEYVSPERVEQLLLMRCSRNNIREVNPNLRYIDQLKSIHEHLRLINKVNLYVHAFVKCRCICTVYELTQSMKDFGRDDAEFKSLRLGPIQKLPVVYDLFKFPAEGEVLEITTIDMLEHLRKYMDVKQKWVERLEMEDVMQYLVQVYSVDSAYALGIRIRSLPLCVQMIKKSQRDAASTRRSVTESCKEALYKEISGAFHKFSRTILQRGDDGQSEVREHYLKMSPELAIMEILQKFQLLMSIDEPETRVSRKQHTKLLDAIQNFLFLVRENEMTKVLFHLAICVSNTVLQESAMELLKPPDTISEAPSTSGEATPVRQPPAKGEILERLKKYMDNCTASGSLSLKNLERIEERLLEDFGFPVFHAFGFGPFLRFLLNDPSAKHLLDECGGATFGSSSGGHEGDSVYRPQLTNLLEFIRQSKNAGIDEPVLIEGALKNQFSTTDVKHLGYGNIHRLITAADKPGKHKSKEYRVIYEAAVCNKTRFVWVPGKSKEYRVIYEAAVCNKTRGDLGEKRVGVMGHMTRDQALVCLHNCPLLEDLEKFSHWSLVFEPEHGKLKEFIQRYGGLHTVSLEGGRRTVTTDVQALEVRPGKLLKVVSRTTNEKFEAALENQDVEGTCGHLVSLVMSNKGLENMPLALMANHMKTALFKLHASGVSAATPGAPPLVNSDLDPAVCFVLACLVRLPLRICLAVADQMFLETLGKVIGSTKSKMSLLQACQTGQQRHRLEKLACLLGVQEWVDGIHARCKPRDEDVIMEITEEEVETENLIMLSDDESECDSSSTASVMSILSDDETEADDEKKDKAVADEVVEVSEESKSEDGGTEDKKEEKEEIMAISIEDEDEEQEDKNEDVETIPSDLEKMDDDEEIEVNVCKNEVEQIRRNEFGIGIHLNSDGERLMKVQQERLGRSLDRLSKDLYSKDTHFVLELVQNADDNSYPEEMLQNDSVTCPTVKFIMDSDGVTVLNNECGFTEINIRALCDVGRSTKGKHKFGYIGQKGIGFKSVFRVTDRPEVHSNGYHICFDVKSGPMGYIVPHWLDDAEELDENWVTKIMLPLKSEMVSQTRSLAARFNDVHPSLLLFLHRLKQMIIENKIENSSLVMRRRDLGENIVEIEYNGKVDRWLVVKKMLDASSISLQAKSGIEVESTEIAIAFPLNSKTHKFYSQALPPKQPVFAFLPLRSYGFRFIIQGDFDVPSSREDVDRDSPWNQWLRNEIHVLFIEALEKFKSLEEFTDLEALAAFFRFVPLEDEVLDFFRPVSSSILQKLKAKECLPVQTSKKGSVVWKIPSQTVIVRDSLLKEVISPELLQRNLNLYYLHEDLAQSLSLGLAQSLGVEQITVEHLLNIGKTLSQSWISSEIAEQVIIVSKWLACLYRSLDEFHENTSVLDSLRAMKIIPLSTGKLICLEEMTVFLPPGDGSTEKKGHPKGEDLLGKLQQDLSMVHPGLITTPDNEVNSQVIKLLQRAGVKQLSPFEIVHHHILPILKSDQWQNKSRDTLISYLIYIKEQLNQQSTLINMEELKGVARVATNHGMKNPAEDAVHFTTAFGNDIDLPRRLPGYDWVLLDSVYLLGCTPMAVKQWHEFFAQLGVTHFLYVKRVSVHVTKTDMANSAWAALETMWPECEGGYYIEDLACEEFHSLVTCNSCPETLIQQMKFLFEMLEQRWDRNYSAYSTVQVKNKTGSVILPTEDSSFSIHLHTLKWLPALQLSLETSARGLQLNKSVTLMQPSILYANLPVLRQILGHMVLYLECEINSRSSFAMFLRIKLKVEVKTVKELLIEAGRRTDKATPAIFKTSMAHVKNIYRYLYENLRPKESQDLFHQHEVIFIPDINCHVDIFVPGRMIGREELWWEDLTGLFDTYHDSLVDLHSPLANKFLVQPLYSDCQEIFKSGVRVQLFPSLSEYAQLMLHITTTNSPTDGSALDDVLNVFRLIGIAVMDQDPTATQSVQRMSHDIEMEKVKRLLKKQEFLPTKKNLWVSLDDKPMIADKKELEKFFIDKPQVHLLQLTEKVEKGRGRKQQQKDTGRKMDITLGFIKLFEVPNLSDCVVITQATEMMQPCHQVQRYMHRITPIIQKFLLSPDFSDVYQALVSERNIAQELTEISFWQVGSLEVIYSIKDRDDIREIRQENCMLTEKKFYFHKNHTKSFPDINREIAKFFCSGDDVSMNQLRFFLTDLCATLHDERGIKDLQARYSIDDLPSDEEEWHVPPPVEVLPPVVRPPPVQVRAEETGQYEGGDDKADSREQGLRSWPPQSSIVSVPRRDGDKAPICKMWPPPKPPGHEKDFQDLPSRIKIDREHFEVPPGERKETGETTERTHRSDDGGGRLLERQDSASSGSHGNKDDGGIGENRKRKLADPSFNIQSKRPAQEGHEVHDGEQRVKDSVTREHPQEPRARSDAAPVVSSPAAVGGDGIAAEPSDKPEQREGTPITNKRRTPDSDVEIGVSPKRHVYFREPVWTDAASELLYEELGSGASLKLPELPMEGEGDKQTMLEIGRWGELVVRDYLLQQQELNLDILRVIWVNESVETGLPYDFEIILIDGEGEKSLFVEVKSTLLDTKCQFEISAKEITFALDHRDSYQVYRIFNAGKPDCVRLVRVDHVAVKMDQGAVKLFMYI